MSGDLPWDEYVAALRPQDELCITKIPNKPVAYEPGEVITAIITG